MTTQAPKDATPAVVEPRVELPKTLESSDDIPDARKFLTFVRNTATFLPFPSGNAIKKYMGVF